GDALRKPEHGVHVVLDQQQGRVARQAGDEFDHLFGFFRPESGHRFVQQQQPGPGRQRQRHFQSPLFAMSQASRPAAFSAGEADLGQNLPRVIEDLRFPLHRAPEAETGAGTRLVTW
ncbi:MAG: hypothetical protein H6R12_627, partial [Proteobacteria bacterium]|nr:hypothetical protein [Pseudomonadota bacterium]